MTAKIIDRLLSITGKFNATSSGYYIFPLSLIGLTPSGLHNHVINVLIIKLDKLKQHKMTPTIRPLYAGSSSLQHWMGTM